MTIKLDNFLTNFPPTESGGDRPPVEDKLHGGGGLPLHGVLCQHGGCRGRALQEVEGDHSQQHLRSDQVSKSFRLKLHLTNLIYQGKIDLISGLNLYFIDINLEIFVSYVKTHKNIN